MTDKPGVMTSEFWIALVYLAGATVLFALGRLGENTWLIATTPVVGAFIGARFGIKIKANGNGNDAIKPPNAPQG